jgi:hypothetical protein
VNGGRHKGLRIRYSINEIKNNHVKKTKTIKKLEGML